MRKWELITDLFDNKKGEIIDDYNNRHYGTCVLIESSVGSIMVQPEKYPQHFRLIEEPEFTEREVKEIAILYNESTFRSDEAVTLEETIETIRKRRAGR